MLAGAAVGWGGAVAMIHSISGSSRAASSRPRLVRLVAYTSIVNAGTTTIRLAADHQATEQLLRDSGVPYVLLRDCCGAARTRRELAPPRRPYAAGREHAVSRLVKHAKPCP